MTRLDGTRLSMNKLSNSNIERTPTRRKPSLQKFPTKYCKHCHTRFKQTNVNQGYCRISCRTLAENERKKVYRLARKKVQAISINIVKPNLVLKVCEGCGKAFRLTHPRQKYCKIECRCLDKNMMKKQPVITVR